MSKRSIRNVVAAVALALGAFSGAGSAGRQAPAGTNLQVLDGVSSAELAVIMNAIGASLGVDCLYCHVAGRFELDERPAKARAREMMRLVQAAATGPFELLAAPSCWTCHRGAAVPPGRPAPSSVGATPIPVPAPDPFARGEFRNLQRHEGLDGDQLRAVMTGYAADLGVSCVYCHPGGDWAGDGEVRKLLTRVMEDAQRELAEAYFGDAEALTCWTCHQGRPVPETGLPSALLPAP